jgi:hypothetical protein
MLNFSDSFIGFRSSELLTKTAPHARAGALRLQKKWLDGGAGFEDIDLSFAANVQQTVKPEFLLETDPKLS